MSGLTAYFVASEHQPRVRRAADAVTLGIGLILIAWGLSAVDRFTFIEDAIVAVIDALPEWADVVLEFAYLISALFAVGLVLGMLLTGRRGLSAARDVLLSLLTAAAIAVVLVRLVSGAWPTLLPELSQADPSAQFPVFRVAVVTAMIVAAAPHLARPVRRLGWVIVVLVVVAASGLGYGFPSDALGTVGVGMIAASAVLLAFGSPRGYPDVRAVTEALDDLGITVRDLRLDDDQSWGVRRLVGRHDDHAELEIKAYGRDATDSQFLAKAWRSLWYRDLGPAATGTRIRAVEHEALVTMMAGRAGVPVPDVVAAATADDELALLAVTRSGRRLSELEPVETTDELLAKIWESVAALHDAKISHGSLTTRSIRVTGTQHHLTDFNAGVLSATDHRRALDVTELLFATTLVVGAVRAVSAAVGALGKESLALVLSYMQLPGVSARSRREVKSPKKVIKDLQTEIARVTQAEMPEPVKLRRVSWRNVLMIGLLVFAFYALVPLIAGIDFAAVWDVLQDADWLLVGIAFVVGHLVFIPEATGMMFAVAQPLPLWPLVFLQVSVKFIGLAVPSVAGRVTMNAAFLMRYGVSATASVTQGAVDGFAGFIVEVSILLVAFFLSDISLGVLDIDPDEVAWGGILLVLLLVVVGVIIAVLRIRRLRKLVVPIVKDAWASLAGVLRTPRRAFGLLGSNFLARIVLGLTLWLVLHAVGTPLNLATALVVVVATNLLAGLVPIPGGIGVAEAFMSGLLVLLGVPDASAYAATITYRMITFYIPAAEGYFAMRGLERRGFL